MRLRTDLVLIAGAVLLLVVGFVVSRQASFAKTYVQDRMLEQKITFATAERLTDEEKNWKPGSKCLVEYAGQPLVTGKQAECYANFFIAMHMSASATKAGYPGATFASLGAEQFGLRAEIADAKTKEDDAKAADAQKRLDAVTTLRDTFFRGDMLRSALLTVFGFNVLGTMAENVAKVSYAGAALFVLLAAFAFMRGRAPRSR